MGLAHPGCFSGLSSDLPGLWKADRSYCDTILRAGLIWSLAARMESNPAHFVGTKLALSDRLYASPDFVAGIAAPSLLGTRVDSLFSGWRVEYAAGLLDASNAEGNPQLGNLS